MKDSRAILLAEPLCAEAFCAFGDVIEASETAHYFSINNGFAKRYHDLAYLDVSSKGGHAIVSIFRAIPRSLPFRLEVMERHPLGSQAFVSMAGAAYLVVVAPRSETLSISQIRCFVAQPGQGVNYACGTWHHPLIAMKNASDFLVIDRAGDAADCNLDEVDVIASSLWVNHTEKE